MTINPNIFKAYDIRGIYPRDIDEESASRIAHAIYTFFKTQLGKDTLSIVLGKDMRESSDPIFDAVSEKIVSLGGTVIDIGLVPTPTVYFTVLNGEYDGGIQISASHNPGEYNGIKIVQRNNKSIIKIGQDTGMNRLQELSTTGLGLAAEMDGGRVIKKEDALEEEINAAYQSVNPTIKPGMKIVIDAANAMGAPMLEALLERADIEIVWMNKELDGSFPSHQADPLQFGLWDELRKKVVEEKADFGIMPDGDGDRIFFVSEKGDIIPATLITSLLADQILEKNPGELVIVDIRYIRNVEAVIKKHNAKMSISRVGHALITEQLNKEGAFFAGESSGHFYFKATGGGESSIRVLLHILNALSDSGKPLSKLLHEYETSTESGERNFELKEGVTTQDVTSTIQKELSDGAFSDLDGIAITYPDWRLSIRSSNTEPLLRLNVEGATKELVDQKFQELTDKIVSMGAEIKN